MSHAKYNNNQTLNEKDIIHIQNETVAYSLRSS